LGPVFLTTGSFEAPNSGLHWPLDEKNQVLLKTIFSLATDGKMPLTVVNNYELSWDNGQDAFGGVCILDDRGMVGGVQ
jgi:hypothetical protein